MYSYSKLIMKGFMQVEKHNFLVYLEPQDLLYQRKMIFFIRACDRGGYFTGTSALALAVESLETRIDVLSSAKVKVKL